MAAEERYDLYLNYLKNNNPISKKAFFLYTKNSGFPETTVRRDLFEMERLEYITVSLGMIVINEQNAYEITRNNKLQNNIKQKELIADIALFEINYKARNIFVSSGTTTEAMIKKIFNKTPAIYTNGFEILKEARKNFRIKDIYLIGGLFRAKSATFCGELAIEAIKNKEFDQVFFTCTGINENGDILNNNKQEAEFLNELIKRSKQSILLIDSSKFGSLSEHNKICNINDINKIVTDKKLDEKWKKIVGEKIVVITP